MFSTSLESRHAGLVLEGFAYAGSANEVQMDRFKVTNVSSASVGLLPRRRRMPQLRRNFLLPSGNVTRVFWRNSPRTVHGAMTLMPKPSFTNSLMEWLMADCERKSCLAVCVKLPVFSSDTNARNCLLSIGSFIHTSTIKTLPRFRCVRVCDWHTPG